MRSPEALRSSSRMPYSPMAKAASPRGTTVRKTLRQPKWPVM